MVFMIDIIAINTLQLPNADQLVQADQDQDKVNKHNQDPLLQDKMLLKEETLKELHLLKDLDLHQEEPV